MTNDLKPKADTIAASPLTGDERQDAAFNLVALAAGAIEPSTADPARDDVDTDIRSAASDVLASLRLLDLCPKHGHEASSVCGRCKNAANARRQRTEILRRQAADGGAT